VNRNVEGTVKGSEQRFSREQKVRVGEQESRALRRAVPFELLLSFSLLPQEGRSLRFPVPFLFLFTCPRLLFTYKICSLNISVHYSVLFPPLSCSLKSSVPYSNLFTHNLRSLSNSVRSLCELVPFIFLFAHCVALFP